MSKQPTCVVERTREGLFIVVDGVRIAERGKPGTPQAQTWVSLEPGWRVFDDFYGAGTGELVVEYNGVRVQ